jgi:osmotically-inducible protein OsmY
MTAVRIRAFVAAGAAALSVACGGSDPEAELIEASAAADAALAQVDATRATVEKRESELKEAQRRLTTAHAALRDAQQEFAMREQTVDRSATDAVLFRTVQKRLLEDGKLESVAISASVSDGVVTLTGNVPNAVLSRRAARVARETPGVSSVTNRVQVTASAAPNQKKQR